MNTTTGPTPMQIRVGKLEARVDVLEKQIVEVKRATLGDIYDEPPTVKHAYALKEICRVGRQLAEATKTTQPDLSGELLNWLDAIGAK